MAAFARQSHVPDQVIIAERHGAHPRLAAYKLARSRVWEDEWARYGPEAVREVMEYYRRFPVIHATLLSHLPREGEILEAGSGLGHWVALLREAGFRARGVDTSPEGLARARATFPGLRFDEGDVLALPYPDASFAGYVSFGVAEHFREGPRRVLEEAARVLRDGGIMVLTVPWISPLRRLPRWRPASPPEGAIFYQYFFTRPELHALVESCGFRIRAVDAYGTLKTLRDETRALHARLKPSVSGGAPAPRLGSKLAGMSGAPGLVRRLRWAAHNLLLENPALHRLAAHMTVVVAERLPRAAARVRP
jgi:SAM-dependent methyltransferase